MKVEDIIHESMKNTFGESGYVLENKSHLHIGHSGDDGSGQTHFKLTIDKKTCLGLSRIDIHKKVYDNLPKAFSSGLHAIEVATK